MSAAEIIERINGLPEKDRQEVLDHLLQTNARTPAEKLSEEPVRYVSEADFKRASDEVFTKYDTLFRKLAE